MTASRGKASELQLKVLAHHNKIRKLEKVLPTLMNLGKDAGMPQFKYAADLAAYIARTKATLSARHEHLKKAVAEERESARKEIADRQKELLV